MLKVVVHQPGGYDRLLLETHADPSPSAGEVVVESSAIGVNYADCIVRMGLYASAKKYVGHPITPGFELAGRVVATGAGVTDIVPGDAVVALTRFGGYATRVSVPRSQVFRLPAGFDLLHAAAFPTVFLTAWYALVELCKLRPGMRVLVHSAAGGVGSALCQIAKLSDCRVVGVVGGSHKIDAAREAGADAVIDKTREPLWPRARGEAPDGYDVVLDANGVATLAQSYRHLRPTGRLVIYGFHTMLPKQGGKPRWGKLAVDWLRTPRFNPLALTNDNKSVLAFNLSYLFDRRDLLEEGVSTLNEWIHRGRVRPLPVREYRLARVADAHRDLESGRTVGKLVLVP
jgi:NADPH:quinone reductase-like Zn-dependent oxidoreductase